MATEHSNTEHGGEKVLFELRVNADGSTTITTSAEWDAYHATRRPDSRRRAMKRFAAVRRRAHHARRAYLARAKQHDLRVALHSLETIYNDLYTEAIG